MYEDVPCTEERLIQLWVDILDSFVERGTKRNGPSNDPTTGSNSTTAQVSYLVNEPVNDGQANHSTPIESGKRKSFFLRRKRSKTPQTPGLRLANLRELFRTFVKEAREPTPEWMYPASDEMLDLEKGLGLFRL